CRTAAATSSRSWSTSCTRPAVRCPTRSTTRRSSRMSDPRRVTKFQVCDAHTWISHEFRQRRAEIFTEGGPGSGPPCTGEGCRRGAGTDLSVPEVCHGEYELNWDVNKPTEPATRRYEEFEGHVGDEGEYDDPVYLAELYRSEMENPL